MFHQWNQPLGSYSGLIQPFSCNCAQGTHQSLAPWHLWWDSTSICFNLNGMHLPTCPPEDLKSVLPTVQWRAASVSHLPLRLVLPSLDLVFIELHIVAPAYVLLGPQPLKPVCNVHTSSTLPFPGSLRMLSSVVVHSHADTARCVLWQQAVLLLRTPAMQTVTCKDLQ